MVWWSTPDAGLVSARICPRESLKERLLCRPTAFELRLLTQIDHQVERFANERH